MTKLLAMAFVLSILSKSALASNLISNAQDSNRANFYLKMNLGYTITSDANDNASKLKMKSENIPFSSFSVGSYFMESSRADLSLNYFFNPTLKTSSSQSFNQQNSNRIADKVVANSIAKLTNTLSANTFIRLGLTQAAANNLAALINTAFDQFIANPTATQNLNQLITAIRRRLSTQSAQVLTQAIDQLNNNSATQDQYNLLTQNLSSINISTKVEHKASLSSLMTTGYLDIAEFNIFKIFIGGGFGLGQIKEKISITTSANFGLGDSVIINQSSSTKKANNFIYSLAIGTSVKVTDRISSEISYAFTDFGKSKSLNFQGIDIGKTIYRNHTISAGIRFNI